MSLDSLVLQSGSAGILSFWSPDNVGLPHDYAACESRGSSCVWLLFEDTGSVEKKVSWQEEGAGHGAMSEMDGWVWVM